MAQPIVIADYIEEFAQAIIRDALCEATRIYWERRAEQFEAVGSLRCDEIAKACRNRARLSWDGDLR